MDKGDVILMHLGMGVLVALAAALGYWDSVAGGVGAMVALDVMWWVDRRAAM